MKYYHNPRCRKSREGLTLLESKGIQPAIVLYMTEPLDTNELDSVLQSLNMEPVDLVRKNEKVYKEELKEKSFTRDEWLDIMIQYPQLIERPILVNKGKAVVGRPVEELLSLI